MKNLILLLVTIIIFSCSSDPVTNDAEIALRGKPLKEPTAPRSVVLLKPTAVNNNEVGHIMLNLEPYLGELPLTDNGGLVDWDNDGQVDDLIVIEWRCYWPKTFVEISVLLNGIDKKVINYSTGYGVKIVGFKDFDNDGDMDVIVTGGRYTDYNNYTVDKDGVRTPVDPYSEYNVGENVIDKYPLSIKDIILSLTIDTADRNPQALNWDLTDYGIKYFSFHVFVYNKALNDYRQTTTYGEWGWRDKNYFKDGETYIVRFTNLEDCYDFKEIEFTL